MQPAHRITTYYDFYNRLWLCNQPTEFIHFHTNCAVLYESATTGKHTGKDHHVELIYIL
jgi:hypothetical protein